jgi:histone deacetylase 1/2
MLAPLNHHPMLTRAKNNIRKPVQKLCLATQTASSSTNTIPVTEPKHEPKTVNQALRDPDWKLAMTAEYEALMKQGTWSLVPPSASQKLVGSKWIFRVKHNSDGTLNRTSLVAQGFTQRPGIDYIETFSPVAKHTRVRVILSLAVTNNWSLRQLDVNNAFLHGHLTEAFFMAQPQAGLC